MTSGRCFHINPASDGDLSSGSASPSAAGAFLHHQSGSKPSCFGMKVRDDGRRYGGVPEWLKGTDCKSVGSAYVGSNPTPSTTRRRDTLSGARDRLRRSLEAGRHRLVRSPATSSALKAGVLSRSECGCSSMVEQQPSKLNTRVRFPSPAPASSAENQINPLCAATSPI